MATLQEASLASSVEVEPQKTSVSRESKDDVSKSDESTPNDNYNESDDINDQPDDSSSSSDSKGAEMDEDMDDIDISSASDKDSMRSTSQMMSSADGMDVVSDTKESAESDDVEGSEDEESDVGRVVMDTFGDDVVVVDKSEAVNNGRSNIIALMICAFVIFGLLSGLLCVYCKTMNSKYHKYSRESGLIAVDGEEEEEEDAEDGDLDILELDTMSGTDVEDESKLAVIVKHSSGDILNEDSCDNENVN